MAVTSEGQEREVTMTKMKQVKWQDRPRIEKLAAAMYPDLVDEATRREMLAANPEMASRLGPLLERRTDQRATDYSKVPGLIPVKRR